MTRIRSFRNADPPALAEIWNRAVAARGFARPLTAYEFDDAVIGRIDFDPRGLAVAEQDGRIVGFAHAGFGPHDPDGRPGVLSYELGTIAMLAVDPLCLDPEVEQALIAISSNYLRKHGAKVLYAGGQLPLNPYYWGIYGGSEWAGIPSSHARFEASVRSAGFEPVATATLFEAHLALPEIRDPRCAIPRRLSKLEITEDAAPRDWWRALALGRYKLNLYRLLRKDDESLVASAYTWEMEGFPQLDGRPRIGLIDMEVEADQRRKGFGRLLVTEILRYARQQSIGVVAVQTRAANIAAISLYQSVGFEPSGTSTLFRLPAQSN